LKCTKFDFGWGFAPDPTGEAYSASPNSLARFKGILLLRETREGKTKERNERKSKKEEKGGTKGGRKGKGIRNKTPLN